MLKLGFAGDEFVGVAAGGGDDEDSVGFGLVRGDGVGERFCVAGDLVVEDVGEVAGGLGCQVEEGWGGAELWCFARTCWSWCGFWFCFWLCGTLFRRCRWRCRVLDVGYEAVGFFGELEAFDVGDAG